MSARKSDLLPEGVVCLFIQLTDRISVGVSVKDRQKNKARNPFLATAGQIDRDEDAIFNLRVTSIVS